MERRGQGRGVRSRGGGGFRGRGRGRGQSKNYDQTQTQTHEIQNGHTQISSFTHNKQTDPFSYQKMVEERFNNSSEGRNIPRDKIHQETATNQSSNQTTELPRSEETRPDQATSKSGLEIARRPGYSTAMKRQINLITNFYQLSSTRDCFYHYDVEIEPPKSSKPTDKPLGTERCREIIFELLKRQKHLSDVKPVYDGKKNMFTGRPLNISNGGQTFDVSIPFRNRILAFKVTLKPVNKKNKDNKICLKSLTDYTNRRTMVVPNEIRLVFNAILSYRNQNSDQFHIRNSFFPMNPRNDSKISLSDGAEVYIGYNQSVRFTERGAALVTNVATVAFVQRGPVLDFVNSVVYKFNPNFGLNEKDVAKVVRKLMGVRIFVTHQKNPRKYTIDNLVASARDQLFEVNGRQISVEKYFLETYKRNLKYPKLQCLRMKGSKKNVYIPMEVCEIVAGQRIKKLDDKQKGLMIRNTAFDPSQKFAMIQDNVETINRIGQEFMKEYGLDLSLKPERVPGRVLHQPSIKYIGDTIVNPNECGVWDIKRSFYKTPDSVKRGKIYSLEFEDRCDYAKLDELADLLQQAGKKNGLQLAFIGREIVDYRRKLRDIFMNEAGNRTDFLIFVTSKNNKKQSYEEIKYLGDQEFDIVTQCVLSDNLMDPKNPRQRKKFDMQFAGNVILKLNTKLGGINHVLSQWPMSLHTEGVIVFGADCIHTLETSDFPKCPSIAAVVASLDYSMMNYEKSCRAQSNPKNSERSQEIIIDLKEMVKKLLRSYYKCHGRKPEKILFYRDGVSEGQFQFVMEDEIPKIKAACQELNGNVPYQPPITMVIVQKRHQARLRPENLREGVGRKGNVPPGTAVDKVIVDPTRYDFYLCSHEGIQGTSKPIHYTVIYDENKVKPEVIEGVTYFLCHLVARCNRSISIPAPVKYADLLAYRANQYVKSQKDKIQPDSDGDIPKAIKKMMEDIEKNSSMFFI